MSARTAHSSGNSTPGVNYPPRPRVERVRKKRPGRKPKYDYYDLLDWTDTVLDSLWPLRPTLRQVYYQLVGLGLVEHGQAIYDRIGDVLSNAREARDLLPDCLVDRTRHFHESNTGLCPAPDDYLDTYVSDLAVEYAKQVTRLSPWYGQRVNCHCWVEKDALAGVLEPVCTRLGISLLPTRGDLSFSTLYTFAKWLPHVSERHARPRVVTTSSGIVSWPEHSRPAAEEHVILAIGDHDPAGLDIPERTYERLKTELVAQGRGHVPVHLERIALTIQQAEEESLPPFWIEGDRDVEPNKSYLAKYGDRCWEVDALHPTYLLQLLRQNVQRYYEPGEPRFEAAVEEAKETRIRIFEQLSGDDGNTDDLDFDDLVEPDFGSSA